MTQSIAFIGGGNMGFALAAGYLANSADANMDARITVADPFPDQLARYKDLAIETTTDNREAVADAGTVVLAVKPQILEQVARDIAPNLDEQLVISVAAGVPIAALEAWLGETTPIVRCMPNTPAFLGRGMTGLVANANVTAEARSAADALLRAVGDVEWFARESDLDTVTALSGSGPAYFFAMIEAMVDAGVALGMTRESALRLTARTAEGAAAMVLEGEDPGVLRVNVTSPGGTTERALSILQTGGFAQIVGQAVTGARDRSVELKEEFGNG